MTDKRALGDGHSARLLTQHDGELAEKYGRLRTALEAYGSLAVAFSGGVDSTLLLDVAAETLDGRVLALTAAGPNIPARETAATRDFCRKRGFRQVVIDFEPLEIAGFRENPPDRCYWCKQVLLGRLIEVARERGFAVVADGSNVDDAGDWRPGLRAVAEAGVVSPLREAGLSKADIRRLAALRHLPQAAKPAAACLASRVPYDTPITAEVLGRIEAAEDFMHDQGFSQVRVRVFGEGARIEVDPDELVRLTEEPLRGRVVSRLTDLGFHPVTIDPAGYRPGSLNPPH